MRILKTIALSACLFSVLLFLGGCTAGRIQESAAPKSFAHELESILAAQDLSGTHWGICIENDQGELLYQKHSDIRAVPASTIKLLTTASALVLLGPDYQIPTEFVTIGYIDTAGILQGDLVIKGYGDPSLAALDQLEAIEIADQWADTLRQLGLSGITGSVWGDAMAIRSLDSRMSWEVDDLYHPYGANVSALSLAENSLRICVTPSENCMDLQIWMDSANVNYWPASTPINLKNNVMTLPIAHLGRVYVEPMYGDTYESVVVKGEVSPFERPIYQSIPLRHPESMFLAIVTEGLISSGIEVPGGIGGYVGVDNEAIFNGDYYPGHYFGAKHRDTLFVHWSPPLSEMITFINTESHNLGAELLIRHIGWKENTVGNFRVGKRVACQWLTSAGLDVYEITWMDGSGLVWLSIHMQITSVSRWLSWVKPAPWKVVESIAPLLDM